MPPESVEDSSEPKTEEGNLGQQQGKPGQQSSDTPAERDERPPDTNGKKSHESQKHWLDYATFCVEVLGIVGLAIYALLTLGIYQESKKSADAAIRSADSVVSVNRSWLVPDTPPQHKKTIQQATLEWHNAGKIPAVAVFSTAEYFIGEFPPRLRSCDEMEKALKEKPLDTWQYQSFVAEDGRYETGLGNTPMWSGQAPLLIHGCIWYTDILSNTEKTTEFFYTAFHGEFGFPPSNGVTLFYMQDHPFIYK